MADDRTRRRPAETPELRRLRRRIDALDRRIVAILNERATLAREAGEAKAAAGRRAIRDAEREREVLLRVTMANEGPLPQADLLALYRRLFSATRALETRDRDAHERAARQGGGGHAGGAGSTNQGAPRGTTATTDRPDLSALPHGGADPVRPGPDGLPPPGARRQRDLDVGRRSRRWAAGSCCASRITIGSAAGPTFDEAILEDLAWLGFAADAGPVRQTDPAAWPPMTRARQALRRGRPGVWLRLHARDVRGLGRGPRPALVGSRVSGRLPEPLPGGTRAAGRPRRRQRGLDGRARRSVLGRGRAGRRPADPRPPRQLDLRVLRGRGRPPPGRGPRRPRAGPPARHAGPDPPRAAAGPRATARLPAPPAVRRPDGSKLSKSAGDTGVRELRAAGSTAAEVLAMAATALGGEVPA